MTDRPQSQDGRGPFALAQVGVPVALPGPLLYSIPPGIEPAIEPGHRVKVPLGSRHVHGYVLDLVPPERAAAAAGAVKLKPIEQVGPALPVLIPEILALVRWIARYYVAPIGITLEAAVPRQVVNLPKRGDLQSMVAASGGAAPQGDTAPERRLTRDQKSALDRIHAAIAARDGTTFLLHGATASGKTEVYLRAAEATIASGKTVLFLVPEIALGTQIMRLIRQRFGGQAAEYHSQLTPAQRRDSWWAARLGKVPMIVGARSAVFAPLSDLGLVIVDEEHEPSYKQGETPRYHGRDTALMRARLAGAVTVLGSATPSLESYMNARGGKFVRLSMPTRIDERPKAKVTLVDLRDRGDGVRPGVSESEPGEEARPDIEVRAGGDRGGREPLSPYLLERLAAVLEAGDQAILFLNRRGFATSVQCHDCGFVFNCPHCNVVLTHHSSDHLLRCHYCNHTVSVAGECPDCRGTHFDFRGIGTQRVEQAVREHLPEARFLRMDFDSTRKRGSLQEMVQAFERGEADILLGTQMVAKGFDFPRVTLVGVINADREMGMPDFRGQERAFQLLTQVAGRAGRGEKPGEVVFQTYMPDHHVILAAARQEYELFWQREILEREPLRYPPASRLANLLFDGADEGNVIRRATEEADRLRSESGVMILGPAPMPLSRLKGQYRWHITLLSPQVRRLTEVLHHALERDREGGSRGGGPGGGPGGARGGGLGGRGGVRGGGRGGVRLQVDMDPASML